MRRERKRRMSGRAPPIAGTAAMAAGSGFAGRAIGFAVDVRLDWTIAESGQLGREWLYAGIVLARRAEEEVAVRSWGCDAAALESLVPVYRSKRGRLLSEVRSWVVEDEYTWKGIPKKLGAEAAGSCDFGVLVRTCMACFEPAVVIADRPGSWELVVECSHCTVVAVQMMDRTLQE